MTALFYPVTQQIRSYNGKDGKPLDGGYVYFGTANQDPRANPIQMFWDIAGMVPAAQPFRTAGGYIVRNGTPANVFAPGDFSSVVLDSTGSVVYTVPNSTDLQLALFVTGVGTAAAIPVADTGGFYTAPKNVENILAQIGDNTGSAGFVTFNRLAAAVQALLVPTGVVMDYSGTTAPTGWVLGSGRTIGDGSSGATERANADCSALFTLLWNSSTNTELPIQDSAGTPTTRGASASNDFAAHKRLPLPDCRGMTRAGKDNMGGTTASRITVAGGNFDGTVMFKSGGLQNHTLTTAELAVHTHTITDPTHSHVINISDPGHTHAITDPTHLHQQNLGGGASIAGGGSGAVGGGASNTNASATGITVNSGTTGITATSNTANTGISANSAGSGNAHTILQPTTIFTVIIKL